MASSKTTPPKQITGNHRWQTLMEFTLSCESGSAEMAVELVVGSVQTLNWPAAHLEQLKRALGRAIQNVVEQEPLNRSGARLVVRVFVSEGGEATPKAAPAGGEPGQRPIPAEAALRASRSPSGGWGFFLVQKQVAAPPVPAAGPHCLIELFLYEEGEQSRKYKRP